MLKSVSITAIITAIGMFLYEFMKETLFPTFSKWESHIMTIGFATSLAIILFIILFKRHEKEFQETRERESRYKDLIFREARHRIKNNIAVIIGFLSIQESLCKSEEAVTALRDSISRMESMESVYEILVKSDKYFHLSVKTYLEQLILKIMEIFSTNGRIKTKVSITDIDMNIDILFPLGIIVNELITNSFKYAFRDRPYGEINISLNLENDIFTLNYYDDGPGITKPIEEIKGFGMLLIDTLTAQVNGKLQLTTGKNTRYAISFPA